MQSHVRMDLFLIPALVALCKRVALRCPADYAADAVADELEALVGAIGGVFQARRSFVLLLLLLLLLSLLIL